VLTSSDVETLRNNWTKYGVAIFPNQHLTLEQYENFSQLFGLYGQEPFLIPMQEHPHIVKLHRKPDEEAAHFGGAWHSDWSFQKAPPSATMLYSEIIPPEGGDTLFANTADAFDDLSDELKERIKNMRCLHSAKLPYAKDGVYATEGKKRTMQIHTSDEANKTMSHPLVRTHRETGRKSLFINPVYTIEIEGLLKEDSDSLLFELYIHMAQEKYIYRHQWQPNMLIMWDNRTVMHMAEGGYDGHERLLHRITIAGDTTQ
jgi:taurine dioxygenase